MQRLTTVKTPITKDTLLLDWQKKLGATQITIKPNTSLTYLIIQGIGNTQERNIRIELQAGSDLTMAAIIVGTHEQKLFSDFQIVHTGPNSRSAISLYGAFLDTSSGTMNGSVRIEAGGKNANARLEERVLLLSKQSRASAIPKLEILTDEVVASHAATVSAVSDDDIFYLEARGLERAESIASLACAFLTSRLSLLPKGALRDTIEASLVNSLRSRYESLS